MVPTSELLYALLGGVLISLSTSLNLFLKGRISGTSGILFGAVRPKDDVEYIWKISFILGLVISSNLMFFINKDFFESYYTFTNDLNLIKIIITGFMVGFGTKLGNGCTSGHGVCGLPRLSIRSIVASATFCAAGMFAANLSYLLPWQSDTKVLSDFTYSNFATPLIITLCGISLIYLIYIYFKKRENVKDFLISITCGLIFGFGLVISGMIKRNKVINFLKFYSDWDPSLLLVLCSSVGINFFLFRYIINTKKTPVYAEKLELPQKTAIDLPLVLGAIIFGLGWGLSGLCPGPLLVSFFIFMPHTILFLFTVIIGQITATNFV